MSLARIECSLRRRNAPGTAGVSRLAAKVIINPPTDARVFGDIRIVRALAGEGSVRSHSAGGLDRFCVSRTGHLHTVARALLSATGMSVSVGRTAGSRPRGQRGWP